MSIRAIFFSFLLLLAPATSVQGQWSQAKPNNVSLAKITSVWQLSDVRHNDWTFQVLQSIAQQHDCIADFPSIVSKGKQSLTRYEFAVALNACLQQLKLEQLDRDTITSLQRLQSEFAGELQVLTGQVNQLESKLATLESQQFSPYVELEGEVIFASALAIGNTKADGSGKPIDENLTFGNRVRLTLEASLTGKDELKVRLQTRNIAEFEAVTGTKMSNLGFDGEDGEQIEIDELGYQFPLTEKTRLSIGSGGDGLGDFVPSVNPLFSGSGDGSISAFGRENPIRRQGEGAAVGISHNFSDSVNFSLAYVATEPEDPEQGIFYGAHGAIAQLTISPMDALNLSLTYVRSYNSFDTGTGSQLTSDPFGEPTQAAIANSWGAEASITLTPTLNLGGRIGFMQVTAKDLVDNPEAKILTWAVLLSLEDVGQEGNLLGFVFGQPPKVIDNSLGKNFQDQNTSLHLEAFYRWQINDNLSITPGFFLITHPEHNRNNEPIYIGTIRTTFQF